MDSTNQKSRLDYRQGEEGAIPARRQRVFMKNRQWYFICRDGVEYGPFPNLTQARRELALFLRRSGVVRFKL